MLCTEYFRQQSPACTILLIVVLFFQIENWWGTCKTIEWGLLHPCSAYVKLDGTLTVEGKRAKDCISNGGLLAGAGVLSGLPPGTIIGILEPLSKLPFYSCDGIMLIMIY